MTNSACKWHITQVTHLLKTLLCTNSTLRWSNPEGSRPAWPMSHYYASGIHLVSTIVAEGERGNLRSSNFCVAEDCDPSPILFAGRRACSTLCREKYKTTQTDTAHTCVCVVRNCLRNHFRDRGCIDHPVASSLLERTRSPAN